MSLARDDFGHALKELSLKLVDTANPLSVLVQLCARLESLDIKLGRASSAFAQALAKSYEPAFVGDV